MGLFSAVIIWVIELSCVKEDTNVTSRVNSPLNFSCNVFSIVVVGGIRTIIREYNLQSRNGKGLTSDL